MKTTYSRGKHLKGKKGRQFNKKIVVLYIFLLIVCTFLITKIPKNKEKLETDQNSNLLFDTNVEGTKSVAEIVSVNMPEKIGNFEVVGELTIEKINFKNYILSKTTDESLDFSVTKFYGPKVNQKGNLCITGHNTKEDLFKNLKNLEIEDTFYIIDKENAQKVNFKIYDKYTVMPTDLKCLNQDTNDKREVTLITCNSRRIN